MTKPAPEPITANFNVQTGLCNSGGFVALNASAPQSVQTDFLADQLVNGNKLIIQSSQGQVLPACKPGDKTMSFVPYSPPKR